MVGSKLQRPVGHFVRSYFGFGPAESPLPSKSRDCRCAPEAPNPSALAPTPSCRPCRCAPARSRRCPASRRSVRARRPTRLRGRCRSARGRNRSCRNRPRMRRDPVSRPGCSRSCRANPPPIRRPGHRVRRHGSRRATARCRPRPRSERSRSTDHSRRVSRRRPNRPRALAMRRDSPLTGLGRSINPPTSAAPAASAMAAAIEPPLMAAEAASPPPAMPAAPAPVAAVPPAPPTSPVSIVPATAAESGGHRACRSDCRVEIAAAKALQPSQLLRWARSLRPRRRRPSRSEISGGCPHTPSLCLLCPEVLLTSKTACRAPPSVHVSAIPDLGVGETAQLPHHQRRTLALRQLGEGRRRACEHGRGSPAAPPGRCPRRSGTSSSSIGHGRPGAPQERDRFVVSDPEEPRPDVDLPILAGQRSSGQLPWPPAARPRRRRDRERLPGSSGRAPGDGARRSPRTLSWSPRAARRASRMPCRRPFRLRRAELSRRGEIDCLPPSG